MHYKTIHCILVKNVHILTDNWPCVSVIAIRLACSHDGETKHGWTVISVVSVKCLFAFVLLFLLQINHEK